MLGFWRKTTIYYVKDTTNGEQKQMDFDLFLMNEMTKIVD